MFYSSFYGQNEVLFLKIDTVKSNFRTSGNKVDSIDVLLSEKHITLPGSFYNHPFGKFGIDYLHSLDNLSQQSRNNSTSSFLYTSLPHVGIAYSFGSVGLQYLTLNYQQVFRKNICFNVLYNRNVAAGSFRYSATSNDQFYLNVIENTGVFKQVYQLHYGNTTRELNGGVLSDSIINQYGLSYASVRKQNASDTVKNINIISEQLLRVFGDDTIGGGILLRNKFTLNRRVFHEIDTSLNTIYVNVDKADTTRDLSQFSRLENAIGLFARTNKSKVQLYLNRSYWMYRTDALQYKTEYDAQLTFNYKLKTVDIRYNHYQNIIGANQQGTQSLKFTKINFNLINELCIHNSYLLPTPMQRLYFSNTIDWQINNLGLQKNLLLEYSLSIKSTIPISLRFGYSIRKDNYYLINDKWRNDTLKSINQFYLDIATNIKLRNIYFTPRIICNSLSGVSSIVPKYDIRARVYWKKTFEKKNNVTFMAGIDAVYKSAYNLLNFDSRISLYSLSNSTQFNFSGTTLDAFLALTIDEIRFYFKYENINYSFTNKTNSIALNYPVTPRILRIGLTWDFFN